MTDLIARMRAAWAARSNREQMLLGGLAATFALVLFVQLVVPAVGALFSGSSGQVDAAELELRAMERLRREYDEVAQRVGGVEEKIQSQGQKKNLLTLLESLADDAKVKVSAMEERRAQENEKYTETKVEVSLKNVTLIQTVTYLHQIEASKQLLSIKSLRVRTRPDNPELLDVTFAVSSFQPQAS